MELVVVTPPTEEPVSLTNAKLQCRVDHSTDDALIGIYIAAARECCEQAARRAFVTQTLRLSLDEWPSVRIIKLPMPPLISVTSIVYTDNDGVSITWPSTNYVVDTDSQPGRIVLKTDSAWPINVSLREAGAIKITYQAGYGAATAVPKKYQMAVQLMLGMMYENREAAGQNALTQIPFGVYEILNSDKGWY